MTTMEKKYGPYTDSSLRKHTKRGWDEWITILNKAGARAWTYQEIHAWLRKKYRQSPWWQHAIAQGYELAIGRRAPGTNQKGDYAVTATKSLKLSAPKVWRYLVSREGMQEWLQPLFPLRIKIGQVFETADGYFGEIRTLRPGERMRMSWKNEDWTKASTLQVYVIARAGQSTLLAFQHDSLKTAAAQSELRKRWKAALAAMTLKLTQS